jgi:hypothetical protein
MVEALVGALDPALGDLVAALGEVLCDVVLARLV